MELTMNYADKNLKCRIESIVKIRSMFKFFLSSILISRLENAAANSNALIRAIICPGIAIFRPSTGEWFILRSEDATYYSYPFGTTGDIPAPGDYDGDGRFDATVFRPSDSTWYVNARRPEH